MTKNTLLTYLCGLAFTLLFSLQAEASVNIYSFTQTTGVYTEITGGTQLTSTGTEDDFSYNAIPLPFTLYTACGPRNALSVQCNGFVRLENTASISYTPLSGSDNILSVFGGDLQAGAAVLIQTVRGSNAAYCPLGANGFSAGDSIVPTGIFASTTYVVSVSGDTLIMSDTALSSSSSGVLRMRNSTIRYEVLGTAPYREFVVQWKNFTIYGARYNALINCQIRISEGGGVPANQRIQYVYGNCVNNSTVVRNCQVGINGYGATDYISRMLQWNPSLPSSSVNAYVPFNSSLAPNTGTIYNWNPIGLTHYITGVCFMDNNGNCAIDTGEARISGQLVRVGANYGYSNASGEYFVGCDSGVNALMPVQINPAFGFSCAYPLSLSVDSFLADVNIGNQGLGCSYLTLESGTGLMRRCRANTHTYSYKNEGSATAYGVNVQVTLDTQIIVTSSIPAWSRVDSNTYTFTFDSLVVGQHGTIVIHDSIACSALLGQTLCSHATISPISPCVHPDTTWDGSDVQAGGVCDPSTDTIYLMIRNKSAHDMGGSNAYRIYEDDLLLLSGTFHLTAGQTLVIPHFANGKTIRLEADQSTGHIGDSRPRVFKELCGHAPYSLHHIIPVPQDDADDWTAVTCKEVVSSYDPNAKTSSPSGVGPQHYITAKDQLHYHIDFQNTGTDTAFVVIIRDTLDVAHLNVQSFHMGASSHECIASVSGAGILSFTFDPINLPDSLHSEAASHGWVEFTIDQAPGNAIGTVINNQAAIYFDHNSAVLTNTSFVTITDQPFRTTAIKEVKLNGEKVDVSVYPNPFAAYVNFELKTTADLSNIQLLITDISGKVIQESAFNGAKSISIPRQNLASGIYMYEIKRGDTVIGTGKIIAD